jgi:hypothetical protein
MAKHTEDLDNQTLLAAGVVFAVLVFVVILGAQAWYHHLDAAERERKAAVQAPDALRRLTTEQEGNIHTWRWVDREKNIVAIPIDRAMELEARAGRRAHGGAGGAGDAGEPGGAGP